MKRLLGIVAALLVAAASYASFVLVAMRTKDPGLLRVVRRVNKATFNRLQVKTAGTPGAYAALIRHRGRRSDTPYETPVGAVATEDGFVITLPYGTESDWLRNVLAAGEATLVHDGEAYEVDTPELVDTSEVIDHIPEKERRVLAIFKVERCLRLRRVSPVGG